MDNPSTVVSSPVQQESEQKEKDYDDRMIEELGVTPSANINQCSTLNDDTPDFQLYNNLAIQSLDAETRAVVDQIYQEVFKFNQFQELVVALNSADHVLQYRGCIGLRKLLSNEGRIPIENMINSNCVPRFIELIQSSFPVLQLEAAQFLTRITSGTTHQIQFVVDQGAIPLLCQVLSSNFYDISYQAIVALGNISGDCSEYRDLILKCGGLTPLVRIMMNTNDKEFIKHGSRMMSNLCRGDPLPNYELVQDATEPLCKVLMQEVDEEILSNSHWAISYLSEGDEERIQRVINTGVFAKLIQHIGHSSVSVLIPCLTTLANICTGNHEQTDLVLGSAALPEIFKLVKHYEMDVRQKACWVLSNIAAGTSQQSQSIIQTNGLVEELFKRVLYDSEEVSREAAWVIQNCTSNANPIDILTFAEMQVIEVYASILKSSQDDKTLAVVLESIRHILECGEEHYKQGGVNRLAIQLESFGLLDVLEELQTNPDNGVYKRAAAIIEKYFETEDPSQINIE